MSRVMIMLRFVTCQILLMSKNDVRIVYFCINMPSLIAAVGIIIRPIKKLDHTHKTGSNVIVNAALIIIL